MCHNASQSDLRVLIAEDDRELAGSLVAWLVQQGCQTSAVYDGMQIVDAAIDFNPDILILDLGMPGISGLQAARKLRAVPRFATTLIVALTGYSDQHHLDAASRLEFDEYLVKPLNKGVLASILVEAASDLKRERPRSA